MRTSSGLEIILFKRFKAFWHNIVAADNKPVLPGVEVPYVAAALSNFSVAMKDFVSDQLQKPHQRDDYCELLELTLVFLVETPLRGISFRK
jgi:hypothetical protein